MAVAALVVEDGTGVEDADAYVDVEFVRTYFENIGDSTFEDDTDDQVVICIRAATQFFDIEWGPRAFGSKTNEDQGLVYPRDDEPLPLKLMQAIAELAKMRRDAPLAGVGAVAASPNAASINRLKAGDVEVAFGETRKSRLEVDYTGRFYLVEKLAASFLQSTAINGLTSR